MLFDFNKIAGAIFTLLLFTPNNSWASKKLPCQGALSTLSASANIKYEIYAPGHFWIELLQRSTDYPITLGKVLFTIPEHHRLDVGYAKTEPPYRRSGVYKYLLAQILLMHPEVTQISGLLDEENEKVLYRALRRLERRTPRLTEEERFFRAVKQTPSYKARKAVGFGKIIRITPPKTLFNLPELVTEREDSEK